MTSKEFNVNGINYNISIDGTNEHPKSVFVTDEFDNVVAYLGEDELLAESIDISDIPSIMSYIDKQTVVGGGDVRAASSGIVFNLEDTYVTYDSDIKNNFSVIDSHLVLKPDHSLFIYGGVKLEYGDESELFDGDVGVIADVMIPCDLDFNGEVDSVIITEPTVVYTTEFEKLDAPISLFIPIAAFSGEIIFHGVMMVTLSKDLKNFYREFVKQFRETSESDTATVKTDKGKKQHQPKSEEKSYVSMKNLYELLEDGYTISIKKEG